MIYIKNKYLLFFLVMKNIYKARERKLDVKGRKNQKSGMGLNPSPI
jgi:hypothetical protein